MEAVTTRERENFMKNKKISKVVLSILTSMSMLSSYSATIFAETPSQETGVAHEHDLIELERKSDLITNGGFDNNGGSWKKTGTGTFGESDGNYYGKLSSNSNNAAVYQVVSFKKNTDYVVKGKVKISNAKGQVFLAVKNGQLSAGLKDNNGKKIETTISSSEDKAGQYQDIEYTFNSGDNTSGSIAFIKWTEENGNQDIIQEEVWIDDVSVKEVSNASEDDQYEMVWADEFNESELDKKNWGYELGHIRGLEQQHYTNSKDNVYLEDGNLVIKATNRKTEDQYEVTQGDTTRKVIYDSGSVRTHGKQEFLYGRIEMKAKLPKGQAVFPAFWTLGSDFHLDGNIAQGIGWPDSGEIDIMELIGNGTAGGVNGNKQVYQTLHYGTNGEDDGKYAGHGTCYTLPSGIFNDDYHVFGINWSKGKIEWYVDDQIVRTVDYSDDQRALECIDRPQYIEFNLALGGAWPGAAGENLAGTKFEVDYVRYARNEQQQKDADTFYANAYKISGEKDVTMTEGDMPDLLAGITVDEGTVVDYSINDEPMFTNVGGNTHVSLLCTGKDDQEALKSLKPGTYNLYYTVYEKGNTTKARTRREVLLTVEERVFEKDLEKSGLELNGFVGDTLDTIKLPEGWVFENPKEKITKDTKEVSVKYSEIDGKVGTALINVQERAQIIAGENSKYDVKDSKPLKITMNVSKENVLKVFVNGKELDTKYYTIENVSNKVNIILSEEYLKTLDNGEYTIKITSTLGNVETTFTVDNSKDDNTNQKPTTDKKDDANNKTNNVTTTVVKNTTQKSTKTGDQTPVELLTIGCLVSLLAIIILKKKKVF